MNEPLNRQAGFTLVELLIALALGTIVLGSVLGIFNSSQHSYNVQEDIAAMQQDVRVGRTFLERDIRMTGLGLGEDFFYFGDAVKSFTWENGKGQNGSDKLTIRYVYDVEGCGDTAPSFACDNLPPLSLMEKMPAASAEATVKQVLDVTVDDNLYYWDNGCKCGDIDYDSYGYPAIITSPDGKRSELFIITQVQPQKTEGKSKIQNRPTYLDANGNGKKDSGETAVDNKIANEYPEGSTIKFVSVDAFQQPAYEVVGTELRRFGQPVCEHIEDLQFAFGLDTDDNGDVDYWIDGTNAGDLNAAGDLSDDDKELVRAVRVSLLGRTAKGRKELGQDKRPAIEDHAAATSGDYFRRRLSQVTVKTRNLGILE